MNTENVSINTFLQWRRDIKGNETVLCSSTTAGLWHGMPLQWNTSDRQNGEKKQNRKKTQNKKKTLVILFVINKELT